MSAINEFYQTVADDALTAILTAEEKLNRLKPMLRAAGHPGIRLKANDVEKVLLKLKECTLMLDELPAKIEPSSLKAKQ